MFLKSVTLRGFKSFADRTTLEFEPGITVVVGPNGSGKSNVVDALSWVLGTHSAKSLRGGSMADVIFAGSPGKPALGRAAVEITIDNAAGTLPIEFSEVTISRAMFATGENTYAINGVDCRLLDVVELLSDTGLGRENHTIVGQGQLDAVLNARPEERRAFVEEAAGILKHRKRKERALRKIAQMEAHTERLTDIVRELKRNLRPLERQAEAATKHAELQAALREVRVVIAVRELDVLTTRLEGEDEAGSLAGARLGAVEQAARETRESETAIDHRLGALTPTVRAAGETHFRLSNLVERYRGLGERIEERRRGLADAVEEPVTGRDPDVLRERARTERERLAEVEAQARSATAGLENVEAARRQAEQARRAHEQAAAAEARRRAQAREQVLRWEGEVAALRSSLAQAASEEGRLASQLSGIDARASGLRRDVTAVTAEIQRLDGQQVALGKQLTSAESLAQHREAAATGAAQAERELERRRASLEARADALRAASQEATEGARALVEAADGGAVEGIVGPLADHVSVVDGMARAVAAALGPLGDAVVVSSRGHAETAIGWVRASKAGRVLVLASAEARPAEARSADQAARRREAFASDDGLTGEARSADQAARRREAFASDDGLTGEARSADHQMPRRREAFASADGLTGEARSADQQMPRRREAFASADGLTGEARSADHQNLTALGARPLVAALRAEPGVLAALGRALSGVYAVESFEVACRLAAREPGCTFVSVTGDVAGPRGYAGGSAGSTSAVASRAAAEQAEAQLQPVLAELQAAHRRVGEADQDLATSRRELDAATAAMQESDGLITSAAERLARLRKELATCEGEQHTLAGQRDDLDREVTAQRERLNLLETSGPGAIEADPRFSGEGPDLEAERLDDQLADAREREVQARLAASAVQQRGEELTRLVASLEAEAAEVERELSERERRRVERVRAIARCRELAAVAEYALATVERSLELAATARDRAEEERAEQQRALGVVRSRLRELDEELTVLREARHADELRRAEVLHAVEAVRARMRDELTVDPDGVLGSARSAAADDGPLTGGEERDVELAEQKEALVRKIGLLGTVNPLALDEFTALKERHQFLTDQLEDLRATREDLLEVVDAVDARIREVFSAAFADVAAQFERIFPRLFPGGEGRLLLTDPDDLLHTGVEVEARPPGKRVKRLSLLSGGERSLTALAVLFAIFAARPSPFYVLDEVEAALDDINLQRFLDVIRDFPASSQLLIVTHQKRTMEVADTLYGITMQGNGVSKVLSQRLSEPVGVR